MKQKNTGRSSDMTSSTTERPATRKGIHPDLVRPTRTISPAFRSGPRLKRHDPNADEIIRFVREFQRGDLQHQGPAGLVKKSVLPAIGGHTSSDGYSMSYNMNESTSLTNTDPGLSSRGANTHHVSNVANWEFPNKSSELTENDTFVRYANGEQFHPISENVLSNYQAVGHDGDESFHFNDNVVDLGQEAATSLNRSSTTSEQLLANSVWKQSLKYDDILNVSDSIYLSKPALTTPRFINGASKVAQLLKPRALPQLPPLTRGAAPSRPPAPSPSLTPPSPRSTDSGEENSFEGDLETDDRMDQDIRNLDYDEAI